MSQLQHLDGYLKAPKTANRAQRAKETAGEVISQVYGNKNTVSYFKECLLLRITVALSKPHA